MPTATTGSPAPGSPLLLSLFRYKCWADAELIMEVHKLDSAAHHSEVLAATRILNHIFVVDRIFAAHLSGTKHGYESTNTPGTPKLGVLRQALAESDHWYIDYVAGLNNQALREPLDFVFTDGQHGRMSREEILAHLATHGAYHRGAVGRILTQLAAQPPRDTFTTFLHKSDPSRRGHA
jgi:uncharacterized damage-inducible protein DinB